MAFDVNSLGGKLIDMQNLSKSLGGSYLEKVQTIPAVSGDYPIELIETGVGVTQHGVKINWVTLLKYAEGLGNAFRVTATYTNSEELEDTDTVLVQTSTEDNGLTILTMNDSSLLYQDSDEIGTMLIFTNVNLGEDDSYAYTELKVIPRRPKTEGNIHIEIESVDLVAPTDEFTKAYVVAGYY